MNAQEIGEVLRQRRIKRKLSQTEAGDLADPRLLQKTVSAIETGASHPWLSTAAAYAAALGCEIHVRPARIRKP